MLIKNQLYYCLLVCLFLHNYYLFYIIFFYFIYLIILIIISSLISSSLINSSAEWLYTIPVSVRVLCTTELSHNYMTEQNLIVDGKNITQYTYTYVVFFLICLFINPPKSTKAWRLTRSSVPTSSLQYFFLAFLNIAGHVSIFLEVSKILCVVWKYINNYFCYK